MAKESKGFQAFRYIFLVLSSVFVLIPIVPLIYMAFKTGAEYTETSVLTPQIGRASCRERVYREV